MQNFPHLCCRAGTPPARSPPPGKGGHAPGGYAAPYPAAERRPKAVADDLPPSSRLFLIGRGLQREVLEPLLLEVPGFLEVDHTIA